jgi:hypothetical protein
MDEKNSRFFNQSLFASRVFYIGITRTKEKKGMMKYPIDCMRWFICKNKYRRDNITCVPNIDQDALFDIIKRSAGHRGSLFGYIYVCVCHSLTDKEHNGRRLVRWCYLKEVAAFSLYHFYIVVLPFFQYIYILVRSFFSFWHFFVSDSYPLVLV